MNNIPTAEEFFIQTQKEKGLWRDYDADSVAADYIQQFAIDFTKLHLEECKLEIINKIGATEENMELTTLILNSYPLTNIK